MCWSVSVECVSVWVESGECIEPMQIVRVATVHQSYGFGVEAVQKPFGARLGALVPLAVR